jgi:L-glyceraldehyde 3-phosphate reductase
MQEFREDRYDTMQYRRCGKWGLKLPVVSLGGWQTVGGYEAGGEAQKIFFRAFDLGITHFDFANNYGTPPGNGEIQGGRIMAQMPRDELIISSKAGYRMDPGPYNIGSSRKYLIASCDASLKRMGLDYVDIFYSHRFDEETPLEETMGALETLVAQGKALYAGISSYSGEQSRRAVDICAANGWAPITIHQPAYNMLQRGVEDDLLPAARDDGFGIIAFCPLAQGLLTDKYLDEVPADSRYGRMATAGRQGLATDANRAKLRKLNELAAGRGQSLAQMSLAWCLRHPEVTSVLTAASRVEQVDDCVGIVKNLDFAKDELGRIRTILDGR